MFFSNSSNALATWSGQDVPLAPQGIPFNLLIASSIFIPFTRCESPTVFPGHPPTILKFLIFPSYICIIISLEHTPSGLYLYSILSPPFFITGLSRNQALLLKNISESHL